MLAAIEQLDTDELPAAEHRCGACGVQLGAGAASSLFCGEACQTAWCAARTQDKDRLVGYVEPWESGYRPNVVTCDDPGCTAANCAGSHHACAVCQWDAAAAYFLGVW